MEWEKGKGVELKIEKDINNSKPNRELLPDVNVPHYLEFYLQLELYVLLCIKYVRQTLGNYPFRPWIRLGDYQV